MHAAGARLRARRDQAARRRAPRRRVRPRPSQTHVAVVAIALILSRTGRMFMTAVSTCPVRISCGTVSVTGPSPRICCSCGTGLRLPGRGRALAAVIDQSQTLPLEILERQRQAAVDLGHLADRDALLRQPVAPERRALLRRPRARPCAMTLRVPRRSRADRPVEERQVACPDWRAHRHRTGDRPRRRPG